jgi:hypothetical protein
VSARPGPATRAVASGLWEKRPHGIPLILGAGVPAKPATIRIRKEAIEDTLIAQLKIKKAEALAPSLGYAAAKARVEADGLSDDEMSDICRDATMAMLRAAVNHSNVGAVIDIATRLQGDFVKAKAYDDAVKARLLKNASYMQLFEDLASNMGCDVHSDMSMDDMSRVNIAIFRLGVCYGIKQLAYMSALSAREIYYSHKNLLSELGDFSDEFQKNVLNALEKICRNAPV